MMNLKIIGKDTNSLVFVSNVELVEIIAKLLLVYRLFKDLVKFKAMLFRNRKDESKDRLVHSGLWDSMWSSENGVIGGLDGLGSEDALIQVDDPACLLFEVLDFRLDTQAPVLILGLLLWVYELDLLYLLASDFVNGVYLTEQSRVNPVVSKVPVEQQAALLQRLAGPVVEDVRILEVVNVLLLKESVAITLSSRQNL